jgi:hypothetical protein
MPARYLTFFLRYGDSSRSIAEQPSTIARLERKGYTRCSYATFRELWRASDQARAIKMFGALPVNPYDFESID